MICRMHCCNVGYTKEPAKQLLKLMRELSKISGYTFNFIYIYKPQTIENKIYKILFTIA